MTAATPRRKKELPDVSCWNAAAVAVLLTLTAAATGGAGAAELRLADSDALGLKLGSGSSTGLDAAQPQIDFAAQRSESVNANRLVSAALGASTPYSTDIPSTWQTAQNDAKAARGPGGEREWGEGEKRKSYLIPALEIVAFDTLLNLFDRAYFGCCDFDSNYRSIKRNLRGKWVVDNDHYDINQLGHPYQGSMYHGFARSAGLNFWEGLGYTFLGSAFWEIAGETTPPSKNDQINTGIGGAFLGEALFRMSNLVLEQGGGMRRTYREIAAAAISPPVGFNRLAFGNRFDQIYSSRDAAYYSRLAVGVVGTTQNRQGTTADVKRTEGVIDFSLDYGLPGKSGYTYRRPFDYFSFQASASTANGFDNLSTRGLLFGADHGKGNYRGIWGLYGSYDYLAPQIFRVASTALSVGTTAEWRIAPAVALQGTALGGVGYASVSTIGGTRDNDYHIGLAPQALLALRMIFGDRASLDLTGRQFFVSDVATDSAGRGGHDRIARADAAFTVRVHKQHAVSIRYLWSRRDASYPVIGDRSASRGTLGIFYTLLGHDRFGAMDWN